MKRACEYTHLGSTVTCSGEAEFVLFSHKRRKDVCRAVAQAVWAKGKEPCLECRRPKWKCWDVLPIAEVTP